MTETTTPADKTSLQGVEADLSAPEMLAKAIDLAFDYRGDVTLHLADGRVLQGFIFDRRQAGPEPRLRVIPTDSDERISLRYTDIKRLIFTGRDTAAGKSWETWVRKYNEKKALGETAQLDPEPLDPH